MFSFLAVKFGIIRPQIRIPHEKLYIEPPGTLRNPDPERNFVFSCHMQGVLG